MTLNKPAFRSFSRTRPHAWTEAAPARRRACGGFSMVEVLVALAITGLLFTASLAALDSSFRAYKSTTDAAAGHVVARIVMQRMMTMIRTGTEFGPYPDDIYDPLQNPVNSDFIEFETFRDDATGLSRVVKIERRTGSPGPYEIWYTQTELSGGSVLSTEERLLLTHVQEMRFTLEYEAGPRLRRATVDMTVNPDNMAEVTIASDIRAPSTRLVSTVIPRRLD